MHSFASMAKWLNPNNVVDSLWRSDFDIVKDQGPNHKTTMMPQVKGLLCIIPTMSFHVTWVWELLVDCIQWTDSLLSTYMLVLVSATPMTWDQSLSLREDTLRIILNGLLMPNWQSYDQEHLGYVYEREWSKESYFFRSHSSCYIFLGLII